MQNNIEFTNVIFTKQLSSYSKRSYSSAGFAIGSI